MLRTLRIQVRETIATYAAPAIRENLTMLLGRPGYALHPDGLCRAGMLALSVHDSIARRPPGGRALIAAAGIELQMEAAFVFDKVADEMPYAERSEDLALAIALLSAGVAATAEAAVDCSDPTTSLRLASTAYGEACAGQFLDALFQRRQMASLEEALQATCLKSGGLGRFVAGFAARVSRADEEGVSLLERFGFHTFTMAQLLDDLRDACAGGEASDLEQGKATLPVIYYRQGIGPLAASDAMLSRDHRSTYPSSGAPLCVAILALAYMNRAEEDLSLLARRGYAVEGLTRFLQGMDTGAAETLRVARSGLAA